MIKIFITIITLCFTSLLSSLCLAQPKIKLNNLSKKDLPKGITVKGDIKSIVQWADKLGNNILVTSETGIIENQEDRSAELYAHHYLVTPSNALQTWKVYDYIKNCSVDLSAIFIENSFEVTDLNSDGIAETWLLYTTVCHGDVSPSDMKIIMVEGVKKYTMRGQTRIKLSAKEYLGGEYKFDNAFKDAPNLFRDFAVQKWKKFMNQ